jgi:hypothetical protein
VLTGLPPFRDNLSVPSSRVKKSKKNSENWWVHSYIWNSVGSDLFSAKSEKKNWFNGEWRTEKRIMGKEEVERLVPREERGEEGQLLRTF